MPRVCPGQLVIHFPGEDAEPVPPPVVPRREPVPSAVAGIPRNVLLSILVDGFGVAPSTADRNVGRLVAAGAFVPVRSGLAWTGTNVPQTHPNFRRPGVKIDEYGKANRFGQQTDEQVWEHVQEALVDRLELCAENPNSYLASVFASVGWAGDVIQAVRAASSGKAAERAAAAETLRELAADPPARLTHADLLEGVQLGLFPETFLPNPKIEARIRRDTLELTARWADHKAAVDQYNRRVARWNKRVEADRAWVERMQKRVNRINFRREAENERRRRENLRKESWGEKPLPMVELLPAVGRRKARSYQVQFGPTGDTQVVAKGLVPPLGPPKLGGRRGEAWLRVVAKAKGG